MSRYKLKSPKQAEAAAGAYHKIEDTVVGAYKKIEEDAVNAYRRMEQGFVDRFLERAEDSGEQEAGQTPDA